MITKSDNNFFEFVEGTCYILLVDKTFAASGEAMKGQKFRGLNEIERVKEMAKTKLPKLGSCYFGGWTLFIVARESYRSKWQPEIFEKIWKAIAPQLAARGGHYQLDTEDYPWIEDIVRAYDLPQLDLTLYHHSEWEWGNSEGVDNEV